MINGTKTEMYVNEIQIDVAIWCYKLDENSNSSTVDQKKRNKKSGTTFV